MERHVTESSYRHFMGLRHSRRRGGQRKTSYEYRIPGTHFRVAGNAEITRSNEAEVRFVKEVHVTNLSIPYAVCFVSLGGGLCHRPFFACLVSYHMSRNRAATSICLSERTLNRPVSDSGRPLKHFSIVANNGSDMNRLRAP